MTWGSRQNVVSSFTVVKGAQIDATRRAFEVWDLSATKKANLDRLQQLDPIGLSSANWWRVLAKTLNRRFDTVGHDRILIELVQAQCPLFVWKPILLWHMTRDEFLVRDFLSGWLYDQFTSGTWRLRAADVLPYLAALSSRPGVIVQDVWSATTQDRVSSGLLRLAVDFDLLAGTQARTFVPYHTPDEALLYLIHAAAEATPNPHRLLHLPDWRMYRFSPNDLQQELFRLHQYGRLHYEVAGSVAELRLPYDSAAAYARAELIP